MGIGEHKPNPLPGMSRCDGGSPYNASWQSELHLLASTTLRNIAVDVVAHALLEEIRLKAAKGFGGTHMPL